MIFQFDYLSFTFKTTTNIWPYNSKDGAFNYVFLKFMMHLVEKII